MRSYIESVEYVCEFAVVVLHTMPLVYNHVLPVDLAGWGVNGGFGASKEGLRGGRRIWGYLSRRGGNEDIP